MLGEAVPPCPGGHPFRPGEVLVGWEPCGCTPGRGGHRTYWCVPCGTLVEIPPCRRVGRATQ